MAYGRDELKKVLQRVEKTSEQIYGDKLYKIILYGSCARGDNTDESDIDLMILLDCEKNELKRFRKKTMDMVSDINLDEEVFLSVLLRDEKYFEENQDVLPFYKNVVREGINFF